MSLFVMTLNFNEIDSAFNEMQTAQQPAWEIQPSLWKESFFSLLVISS